MPGAWYNENDPFAAAWLRELIAAGLIAPGVVDERSIVDVKPDELAGFEQCHFFAGIGGWSLALRMAGWPDDRPVWTGSCPCQPFSAAGKRKGFADDRHLWPVWQSLIEVARPGTVFGEQVASAAEWLGLVRSDMGALGYVFGARPVEAASAGADHLRDRYWFVAHANGETRRREARTSDVGAGLEAVQEWPAQSGRRGGNDLAHTDNARSQGRSLLPERAGERIARADGVADSDEPFRRLGGEQPAGQFAEQQQDTRARDSGALPDTERGADVGRCGKIAGPAREAESQVGQQRLRAEHLPVRGSGSGEEHEWVIGADGKARRVKPGVCLLVDGFPARVGLLRGFGNAIDPRAATAFIAAAEEAMRDAT